MHLHWSKEEEHAEELLQKHLRNGTELVAKGNVDAETAAPFAAHHCHPV